LIKETSKFVKIVVTRATVPISSCGHSSQNREQHPEIQST